MLLLRLVIVAATLGTGITVIAQEPERREPGETSCPESRPRRPPGPG